MSYCDHGVRLDKHCRWCATGTEPASKDDVRIEQARHGCGNPSHYGAAPEIDLLASDKCIEGMGAALSGRVQPDFTVIRVGVVGFDGGLIVRWETKSAGFGELTISAQDGVLCMDTEGMGPTFVKNVLSKMADNWFESTSEGKSTS